MADKQSAVAPKPATTKQAVRQPDEPQADEQRWIQDALEDDEVREALKTRQVREKTR